MFDSGDISGTITSPATNTRQVDVASIAINWTGTSPVGVLTVEARNGEDDTWSELDFGQAINITGNTGEHTILFNELHFEEIRLVYTATSGTGTLDAILLAKTVGA